MPDPIPRVFVALDFADPIEALALAARLNPRDCGLKVGKEMFVVAGPEPVRWMVERGFNVFLDLKFHDIPNTTASACGAAARLGVFMLNVHAAGGQAMLEAARGAVDRVAAQTGTPAPLLIAVTVLTSLGVADLAATGIADAPDVQALRLARLTQACGLDGVVCSAREAAIVRAACGPSFTLVTPGIRLAGAQSDDQARVVTPRAAIDSGADYLVIGRPITAAADPAAALHAINNTLGAIA